MKNVISLSILFIVVLCSCKSNSFLNQRYTNFGHAKTKTESFTSTKKTNTKQLQINTKEQEDLKQEVSPTLICENNLAVENNNAPTLKAKTQQHNIKHPIALVSKQFKTIANKHLQIQKEKKSKETNVYKGVVNKILKIILVLLILAVIVGVIVIITLLM